ncbi:MAG: hypothetical protein M0Z34_06735 [Nitrospiraceae bacterium]|nr:hypothetical protein [Nitrospiraceae bacterium]
MPHTIEVVSEKIEDGATEPGPFGPGFRLPVIQRAARMEIVGSSFADEGSDWVDFVLRDQDGREIARRRIAGY